MKDIVDIAIPVFMGLTFLVLCAGIVNLFRGARAGNAGNLSNLLMRWRVLLQFIVICLIAASAFLFQR
ncbi:MAG: twin transmembrane helix small protein [Sneathiellaceae bacterium]